MLRHFLFLPAAAASVLAVACAGDDDSADDDDGPVGAAPVIDAVDLCEIPNMLQNGVPCEDGVNPDLFGGRFRINVSDVDGDLQNPYFAIIVGDPPALSGRLEGDLGEAGRLDVDVCSEWPRSSTIEFEVWMEDNAGNASARFQGTWAVPAAEGEDNCPLQ